MSITLAADELNMTQPAVSIAIKELEAFYNTKLFDRIGKKIYLTESGEKLRIYADTIKERFDLSVKDIRDKSNLVTCRIGVNVTIGESHLSDIIKKLNADITGLKLYVTVGNNRTIEEMLANNEIDFAITDTPSETKNLVVTKLYSEELAAVCLPSFTKKDTVTIKELSEMPLLLREKGSGCSNCIDSLFDNFGCFPEPIVQSISNLTLINLVQSGSGVTILPESLVKNEIVNGSLKRLTVSDGSFTRDYYLIYHNRKYLSEVMRSCIGGISSLFDCL
jgi:DNA-binding transcriptional LysR family regulator